MIQITSPNRATPLGEVRFTTSLLLRATFKKKELDDGGSVPLNLAKPISQGLSPYMLKNAGFLAAEFVSAGLPCREFSDVPSKATKTSYV